MSMLPNYEYEIVMSKNHTHDESTSNQKLPFVPEWLNEELFGLSDFQIQGNYN